MQEVKSGPSCQEIRESSLLIFLQSSFLICKISEDFFGGDGGMGCFCILMCARACMCMFMYVFHLYARISPFRGPRKTCLNLLK